MNRRILTLGLVVAAFGLLLCTATADAGLFARFNKSACCGVLS